MNKRFVFQSNQYGGDCLPCTPEIFNQLIDSQDVAWKIATRQAVEKAVREGLPVDEFINNEQYRNFCLSQLKQNRSFAEKSVNERLMLWSAWLKNNLPVFIFGATSFDHDKRRQEGIHLSGLFMFDADKIPCDPKEIYERTQAKNFPWKVVMAHKTSSDFGLRLVCEARHEIGNIADNQIELAKELELLGMMGTTGKPVVDASCIDASRISYCPRREDIYYMDLFNLFCDTPTIFASKYEQLYREGKTAPTNPNHHFDEEQPESSQQIERQDETPINHSPDEEEAGRSSLPQLFGHPVTDFITALLPNGAPVNSRHREALKLADDLVILLGTDREAAHRVLLSLGWVQDIINERGADEIKRIMDAAIQHYEKREKEYLYAPQPSKRMRKAIEQVTGKNYAALLAEQNQQAAGLKDAPDDILHYTKQLGREIQKLFKHYPLLPLVCYRLPQKHYAAGLFAGGAFAMTLMTRSWYRFYANPGKCRLNCLLEIIGPSGNGKRFLVRLYQIMTEPKKGPMRLR